jgi:lactate racemase
MDHRSYQPGPARPIVIPWGPHECLALELPAEWSASDVVCPDLSGVLANYAETLSAALERIVGLEPLGRLARPGSTVAIIVDDPSRWTPVREALPILLRAIHAAGVRREDVTISVGVGRHRAVDAQAMRDRVGGEVADIYPCHSPPLDDPAQYVYLGQTPQGVPVKVFRQVAEADLRILVGSVLPHLQAGFGGGYKLIFPGCSHRSTLVALHGQGLGGAAGRLLGGDLATNPMRVAIRAAAALLPGPCLSVSHLLGDHGQVLRVIAGHPDAVQDTLSDEARSRFQAPPALPADLVVAGNAPWPGDPMMSFKVLLQHRAAGKPAGVLAGFFWTDPAEIDRSFPMAATKAVAATGAIGGYVARHGLTLADRIAAAVNSPASFMIRWARELVVDRTVLVYAPPLHERFGTRLGPVHLFADQASLWHEAAGAARPDRNEAMRVRIFPHGGLTYAPFRESSC